jgi:protein TonB
MAYPEQAIRDRVGGRLLLEFSVAKDGRVESVQVKQPSGHSALDTASLLAVRLAAPFPPIPPQIGKERLAISAVFNWVFDEGFRRFPPLGLTCPRARS